MKNRYIDLEKFVTTSNDLTIVNTSEVYISSAENYDIVVDLDNRISEFETLKPFISLIAMNICKIDNMVQEYNQLHCQDSRFDFDLAVIYLDEPNLIRLDYWGIKVNTQFTVFFEYKNNQFILMGFGRINNISPDWNKTIDCS